ncbi:hypothetical protein PRZ48_007062 [Zasmidium cellare]|uniref:Xylanolytic transcriptional activator regulatory domain-containing protein n=1 Tax=Zasmidium cellare TaxID=395010 RepID=A0ABR0EJB8_ZASCE|nr:hypothetical protein PRZ48_007062 [Zasmidium cellare]
MHSPRNVTGSLPSTPPYDVVQPGTTHQHHLPTARSASNLRNVSPNRGWINSGISGRQSQPQTQAINPSHDTSPPTSSSSSRSSLRSEDEHLTNLFYSNFFPGHPFLVPRGRYFDQIYPACLRAVVKFIGSHYAPNISSDCLRASVTTAMAECNEKSPEVVQALLLYSIAMHARYEPMEAMPAMTKAADMAIDLGMNTAEFAIKHGHGDPIYEESLRRTWWELYVADGYLASLHRHTSFRSNTVLTATLLPCEEGDYGDGSIPCNPPSLDQFDMRLFSDEELQFSSFCYRIDAVRILSRVIAVSTTNEAHADAIQAIDNAIAGWKFHLPNDKATIVNHAGELDQMLFQATLFIHCASIFLHFPRSELPITMPPAAEIACARQHMEQVSPTSTQHAVKAMSASKDLANLATLPMEKNSPFLICGLVFACIVQLSACSAYPRSTTQQNRDRVALLIGVLKSLSRNWAIAQYVSGQLKRAANEIFNPRSEVNTAPSSSSYDSAVDLGSFPTDVSWLDLFYNDGMQGGMMGGGDMTGL